MSSKVKPSGPKDNELHHLVNEQNAKDTWTMLLVFRCVNAMLIWTFFQPDEYFQSLEPAWQMAFGSESGAWITWEWHYQLRSSLHPAIFAFFYYIVDKPMELLHFFPQFRALVLAVLPNLVQAYFAAIADYYTWQFSEKLYGIGSSSATAVLLMTVFSPWQWFCSTRTFSNCVETMLTITALYFWPWKLSSDTVLGTGSDSQTTQEVESNQPGVFTTPKSVNRLRISLLLAGIACILRPTNLLIWFCVLMPTLTSAYISSNRVVFSDYVVFCREVAICGSVALLVSGISDRLYFGEWTFPAYQWLYFNVAQDLAVFYGRNDWHYFLSQGLPLLLTTYLPFTLVALYQTTSLSSYNIRSIFSTIVFVVIASLSLISHKEVRFIYPLLPILHLLTAPTISAYFQTSETTNTSQTKNQPASTRRKPLLALILSINVLIAGYTSVRHQRGVITVTSFLRQEYERVVIDGRGRFISSPEADVIDIVETNKRDFSPNETFAAFLMPCHSTPWRSQLIHPGLKAWALTCDPPIHVPASDSAARAAYRDEADRFYDNIPKFLDEEVGGKERPWPAYVVGFEGIEEELRKWYEGKGWGVMSERWRTANSDWHDDQRRVGDVIVWQFGDVIAA